MGGSRSLGIFFGKIIPNNPKPVVIFWSGIPCVFCLYYTLLKVVGYYDLSILSMSVMAFQSKFFWNFFNFAKPLRRPENMDNENLMCDPK